MDAPMLDKFAELAEGFPVPPEGAESRRSELDERIRVMQARSRATLGIEIAAKATIDREIEILEIERAGLGSEVDGFQRLSLEPLRWRNDKGQPVFAVFSLSSPEMRITFYGKKERHTVDSPALPAEVAACYRGLACRKLRDRLRLRISRLTARFDGMLPDSTRAKINQAKKTFGDKIYLIAEVKSWEYSTLPRDPLVVGFAAGTFWLIDKFDTTPVEEYIAQEFTS